MKEKSKDITLPKEEKSKAIPELSDEEIEHGVNHPDTDAYDFREGAKWYRKQLKEKYETKIPHQRTTN